jgi:tetratricopeptide (TPR) repeat protein
MGDFEKAEEFYLQAIKINPKYLNAVNNLAAMYMQHGKFEKAVEYGERVLSINPSRHEPRSALAISYASLGDYIKAEEHFNLYAIADPESGKNLRLMLNNIKERHLSEVKYGGSDPRDYDDYDEDNEEE